MKPTPDERADLIARIAEKRRDSKLSDAEIGRLSAVHPSQVGRICRGEFRTISNNVVQICRTLGLTVEIPPPPKETQDAAWSRLQRSMRKAWDRTPEGAAKLAKVLEAVADVRRA